MRLLPFHGGQFSCVTGFFDHTAGIGHRLDGWANRDLNVGAIVSLSPNLQPVADLLGVDVPTMKKVLASWGPGKYDAELDQDSKTFRPDGKSGATLLPAAFGQAGVNNGTYTGWGSVTYWNAYVANTQMHGKGAFSEPRLTEEQFPVGAKAHFNQIRNTDDRITSKLAALQYDHAFSCSTRLAGRASTSTFRPTASAVFGLTPGPTSPSFSPASA